MSDRKIAATLSEWQERHNTRLRLVVVLEGKAEFAHKLLVEKWKGGEHDSMLLAQDREIHKALEEARHDLEVGLKAKP